MSDTVLINVDEITANPYQVREAEDPAVIAELAANIEKNGLLQPPTVRPCKGITPVKDYYQIAFGHTRLAAFKLLASQGKLVYLDIPCFVKELDDLQMFEMAVAENIKRRDLNPIERARAMQTYMDKFNKTSVETGEFFNCDESTVRGSVRLLGLPEPAQEKLAAGEISIDNARKLLTVQRVAPNEIDDVITDLTDAADPDKIIANALINSENVFHMFRGYPGSSKEPTAGEGLWPLAMSGASFTHLPRLTAAEAAKSLGWEFTADNRAVLEARIEALESPLSDAIIPELIASGADPDVIDHLSHLLRPPACTACPMMARSDNNYYCGLKKCHERKKSSFLVTAVEQKSKKLGIAIYDPKADGKDIVVLRDYNEKDKRLFADRDADLRLRAAPWSYKHDLTDSPTVEVILVGKRAEKVKEKERKERESQSPQVDWNAVYEKRKIADKKINAFLWNQAVPLFMPLLVVDCLPLLEAINKDLSTYVDVPDDAIPSETAKTKTKVEYLRRMIIGTALSATLELESVLDSETPVADTAKLLQGIAKAWGVTLPKDWLKKAAEEDAVSSETKKDNA